MEYSLTELKIKDLFELVEKERIDLNPSYQRNFIWSTDNQMELIDTILKTYPLPNFFFYKKPEGGFEMVDGQQRTKTIYRFITGNITSSKAFGKVRFTQIDQELFLNYRIPVIVIESISSNESLQEFYVLINKKGVHLNIAEVNKSEYYDTNFLRLANDLLSYQNFINLNLFSEATVKRMNDRAFVEELLAFLYSGIKDKKKSVESIFQSDIGDDECKILEVGFKKTIDKLDRLNRATPICETRYKQKNDFYTFFCFVNENLDEPMEILQYQYRILLILDRVDPEGRQFIRPSNDECEALREYANNCVTQSNSKKARENRLKFFNSVLKNISVEQNDTLSDILNYLTTIYNGNVQLKKVGPYELLDVDIL